MSAWYYAHGGEQKGPVPISELQRLTEAGEFDPHNDLVWQEGMPDWKPAASVPELSALTNPQPSTPATADATPGSEMQGSAVNPYQAPATISPMADDQSGIAELTEIEPGSEPLEVGTIVSRAFELTKKHFGMIFVVGLVYVGVSWGAGMFLGVIEGLAGGSALSPTFEINETTGEFDTMSESPTGPQIVVSIITNLISHLVGVFLSLGTTRIGLNLVSGKPFEVGMIFGEGQKLLRAFGASLLYGFAIVIGLLLLIVPGIYIALRWGQYMFAIVDKDMGITESLNYSSHITQGQKMNLFALAIISFLIVLAGLLALVVGLIFAYPLVWMIGFVVYRWLQYGSASTRINA